MATVMCEDGPLNGKSTEVPDEILTARNGADGRSCFEYQGAKYYPSRRVANEGEENEMQVWVFDPPTPQTDSAMGRVR